MAWRYGDSLSLSTWGMHQSFTVTSYYSWWSLLSLCYLLAVFLFIWCLSFAVCLSQNCFFLCMALLFPYHSFCSSLFIFLTTQQLQTWRYLVPYHNDAWPPASPLHLPPLRHDVTIAAALRLVSCLLMGMDNTFHTVSTCGTVMFPLWHFRLWGWKATLYDLI